MCSGRAKRSCLAVAVAQQDHWWGLAAKGFAASAVTLPEPCGTGRRFHEVLPGRASGWVVSTRQALVFVAQDPQMVAWAVLA